ncbi:MAG: uracil phosphoribosyltransferase [Akkermansiaceae bacterium]|jgi:uracil phosphoribosyltransferase|nr:uracil phosphoribosyltransferase [Akkermansiaceae bacterium]MDP4647168.1 uracil phosphoribosyltransferase [Akkermansiaceae bacterium]MDP4720040.1 uracil phosphoribosyltransferase [Akkermansiaceae bacterium]MDP4780462.1 uracil phosphoribosyltransferase [Akkermansiaceae bacterium]MDP4847779.1 uracil phosphoribosyltransferase [Akkermansiaceae bacterium]
MTHLIDHPLISHELTRLRNPDCPSHEFRQRVRRIASLMVPSVTSDLECRVVECTTPLELTSGTETLRPVVLVPILRAGLGFLDGFLDLMPEAAVAHLGMARNEKTLQPEAYYLKHPAKMAGAELILLDPMLATGGSAAQSVTTLKEAGAKRIRFVSLLAAPEGIATLEEAHPDVPIYTAAIDRCLNEKGYILPGLGDAGDRLFGTF